jgi:glucosamine 6-phosphate synthetase-like amidotransferase/phosphosugar isomerase protein
MCGIYCSNDLSTFEVLEEANKKRGNFSTGIFYSYNKASYNVIKEEGSINWYAKRLPTGDKFIYLGHNQAPTESGRVWKEETSHPFSYGDWVVAHNGVLTNFEELKNKILPKHDNPVDSSIIPAILAENDYILGPPMGVEDEKANIIQTLELLKGTFALWIVNMRTLNVYIARQGSTLFYKGSNISSVKGRYYRELKEGVLYSYSYKGLTPVDEFVYDSPFLTL